MLYRIEKERLSVSLTLAGGVRVDGHIFVQPQAYGYSGHEHAIDIFNGTEPFVPVQTEHGVIFIAKDRVVEVDGIEPEDAAIDEMRRASSRSASLEVTLAGGETRAGTVLLEMPSDRPRLLDFLNRLEDRFLAITSDDGVRLINTRMIERVRPLD
ncbi:MAG: hypothetical protein ABJD07_13235 [Gemmatimonadaceae bacterium]